MTHDDRPRGVRGDARAGASMSARLSLQPITWQELRRFVGDHHRNHQPPQGWKWGIAVNDGIRVVGVVSVGRPVNRHLDDGWTLEVTRNCTDGTKNACSMLYGAAWRAGKAMGYTRMVTYTGKDEPGTSLIAAGWRIVYQTPERAGGWSCPSRPRVSTHSTAQKTLWEAA